MFSINREWLCRRHQDRSRKTLSVKFPRCRCAASLTLKQKCVIYELFLRVKHGTQMFWQRQYNSFSPSILSCVNIPLSNTWVKLEVCYDNLIKMGMIKVTLWSSLCSYMYAKGKNRRQKSYDNVLTIWVAEGADKFHWEWEDDCRVLLGRDRVQRLKISGDQHHCTMGKLKNESKSVQLWKIFLHGCWC